MWRKWKRPICWILGHKCERFVFCRRCGKSLWECHYIRLTKKEIERQARME
jgi:hypothetical protein